MASIALRGPQHLAPEVVPGASLHSEALSPECGRECQETRHTVQGKSWDHFCSSAEGTVSDSVFPSMIAHCGAIGMGRRCKSLGGDVHVSGFSSGP